jgi:protein gp37
MGNPRYRNGFDVTLHDDQISLPLRWRQPKVVFVNSMSDLFHPKVPTPFIVEVFDVMARASQHTFQVLTKRPKRAAALADTLPWAANVWMGTSIESQDFVVRADDLRRTPAAVRFLSLEPLLGPLDLELAGIDWVIVGGESGPGARPPDADWIRSLRDQCVDEHVRFFFKQWGGRTPKAGGRVLDGRVWDEMPQRATLTLL